MKEDVLEKLSKIEDNQPEVSFAMGSSGEEIQIEFADGWRVIPEYVTRMLGGIEDLKAVAPQLKAVNYADFVRQFDLEIERQKLNEIGQKFVSNHFGGFGRRFQ